MRCVDFHSSQQVINGTNTPKLEEKLVHNCSNKDACTCMYVGYFQGVKTFVVCAIHVFCGLIFVFLEEKFVFVRHVDWEILEISARAYIITLHSDKSVSTFKKHVVWVW